MSHTQRVVAATKEIIEGEKLKDDDANKLIIAAWFHDAGYTKSNVNHEEESVTDFKVFFKEIKKFLMILLLVFPFNYGD